MAPVRGESQESWQLQELKERLGMGTRLETSLDSLTSPIFARGSGASQASADSSFCDEAIAEGCRVRVLRGRRFRDFGTGDAGSVIQIDREAGTCIVAFDGVTAPVQVALRHLEQDATPGAKMLAPELNRDVPSPPEQIEQRSSTLWSSRSVRSESHADSDQGASHLNVAGAASPGTSSPAAESLRVGPTLPSAPSELPVHEKFRLPPVRPERLEPEQPLHENDTSQLRDGTASRCNSEEPSAIRAEMRREVARLQSLVAHEAEERAVGLEKVEQNVEQLRSRYGDVAEQLRLAVPRQEHITLLDARFEELMQAHKCNIPEEDGTRARLEVLASRLDKAEVATANTNRLDALEASIRVVQAEVLGAAGTTEGVSSLAAQLDQLNAKLGSSLLAQDQRLQALASEFAEAAHMRAAATDIDKQVQAEGLVDQLRALSARLDVLDSDVSAMQARLSGADGAVAAVQAKLSHTDAVLDTLAATMDATVSDVDKKAHELQSEISQVEQLASEAIKVGRRMSETLAEHVKLAQDKLAQDKDKDGILDLIQTRMEAFGELEKHLEIGQRVCKVLEAQSDSVEQRSQTDELHKEFEGLSARVEALEENFAAEAQGSQVEDTQLEVKCRQVVIEKLAAEAVTREKAMSQMEERCRQAVLMELRADASVADAARKQDFDAAHARLRSELEVQNRAGTAAAIAHLRSELEAHASRQDPQLFSPGFTRRGFSPPPGPARQCSRSPSPTASQITSTRSAHSLERKMQAHWAVQPAPASPGQPSSLPHVSSPKPRAMSPGSPLTFSLPPPPLQAMAPATASMWPGAASRTASRPLAGQAVPGWRQRPMSAGGVAASFPHVAQSTSSSSLRAVSQGGPAGTLCSMCGNMSMDDSVMCRRCTLSHSRGKARNGRARNASPVPLSAHPQPMTAPALLGPAAAPPAMVVTAQQPVAAMHWTRPSAELPSVPPSGAMGAGLGSGSTPPTGSTTPTMAADEVRTPANAQGVFRTESSTITNSARSNRESTTSLAGDSGAAKVIRGASSGPEAIDSPVAQPVALAPTTTASPALTTPAV